MSNFLNFSASLSLSLSPPSFPFSSGFSHLSFLFLFFSFSCNAAHHLNSETKDVNTSHFPPPPETGDTGAGGEAHCHPTEEIENTDAAQQTSLRSGFVRCCFLNPTNLVRGNGAGKEKWFFAGCGSLVFRLAVSLPPSPEEPKTGGKKEEGGK